MEIGMNVEVNHWLFIYTCKSFSAITILKQEKQIFFATNDNQKFPVMINLNQRDHLPLKKKQINLYNLF